MQRSVTRRHILGGIGATLASPLSLEAQTAASASAFPQIQLDLSINLDRDEVYTFLLSPQTDITFDPVLTPSEQSSYTKLSTKLAGQRSLPDSAAPKGTPFATGLPTAKRLTYFVRKHGVIIGEVKAIDVYTNPLMVSVTNVLFVSNAVITNSALTAKIKSAFDLYDPNISPDPFKYAYEKMGTDVTADMFIVRSSYSLHKTSAPVPLHKQSDFIQDFYKGRVHVVFYGSPHKELGQYLEEQRLDLEGPKEEDLGRVPKAQPDIHIKEISDTPPPTPAQEDHAADDVITEIVKAVNGPCALNAKEKERIAAILGWPEFKVDWVDVKIQIGCVWVIFSLPVPRIRFSALVLFAYVVHSNELLQDVVNMLLGCLVRSVIAGAIVGLVLGNFPSALAAFEILFEECVTYQVTCALPGLALVVESSSWS